MEWANFRTSTLNRKIRQASRVFPSAFARLKYNERFISKVQRMEGALANGETISGADASFYMHEAAEATVMSNGAEYAAAHEVALSQYGVSPFSVYHPEVISQYPELFNAAWKAFWGM